MRSEEKGGQEWKLQHRVDFPSPVEALEFLKVGGRARSGVSRRSAAQNGGHRLAVTSRESNYVHIYDAEAVKETAMYNLNMLGDDHVSFSALDLSSSHDGRMLLVGTGSQCAHARVSARCE